ncbi:DUF2292 domain-containing protein [Xylanibacillus composti]|uniref:DUF2292 domain-containing protein n=1 Tax=Xylanibacillus composti TaxID=1572762 RepID=A0A8J4M3H7_9BACL|nr:YezD family protein [Xylanibacillus composti]MDT9726975.1 DUF2292 domain-containing protein [Xylanibacillus composti]GIQ69531.1 hypothetical protein XYCOK13_23550 [Xylanibacillus composti]
MEKSSEKEKEIIHYIQQSLSDIQYGSIHIVIHEGRIVQIERTEKLRMDSK